MQFGRISVERTEIHVDLAVARGTVKAWFAGRAESARLSHSDVLNPPPTAPNRPFFSLVFSIPSGSTL